MHGLRTSGVGVRRAGGGSRRVALALGLLAAFAGVFAITLAVSARADATYNLKGTWDTYGTGGGYSGTFTITDMDTATGQFSGTGDGGTFVLQGVESGSSVKFTQSEGSYVATDTADLELKDGKLQMVNGVWSDSNGSGGSFTASIAAATGSISGTVTRDGQGLGGVTLTASTDFGETASAVTAANGAYTISVSKLGVWRVVPSGPGLKFKPKDHLVTVDGEETGWDFTAIGGASLEATGHVAESDFIKLLYRGRHWDPTGGPITLTFGGQPAGTVAAASDISGDVKINYWPHRHTINNDKDPPGKACWGDLVATQGDQSATAEFEAKAVGVVIWSLDPRISTGQVFCRGEENGLLAGGANMITLDFNGLMNIYTGPGKVIHGIPVSQLANGHHLCYYAPTPNVNVTLTLNNGIVQGVQASGPCPSG